jgi:para-nitrobenzyl esterase
MYEFAWKTPCFGGSWALHGVELPFVFGIPDYGVAWDGQDSDKVRSAADPHGDRYKLTDLTIAAWSGFARTGNPSTSEHTWPAYDLAQRSVMVFDHETRLVDDPDTKARQVLS